MSEICFEVDKKEHLMFCVQLTNFGCDVIAINSFCQRPLVWVAQSPILQNFMFPTNEKNEVDISGFLVKIMPNKKKGKLYKKVKFATYFDLLLVCEREKPLDWSPPSSLNSIKHLYH